MSAAWVGAALCFFLLALWLSIRVEEKRARQAACLHEWRKPFSLYDEGKYWNKVCGKCKKHVACDKDGNEWKKKGS